MRQKILTRSLVAAGALSVFALFGYATFGASSSHSAVTAASAPPAVTATAGAQSATPAGLPNFTSIVQQHGPAVVNISVTSRLEKTAFAPDRSKADPDDPFSQFFRQFGIPQPRIETPARGLGSGFIVSPDGVILTNAHVVADASTVTVKLTDRREYKAKVVGFDRASDVAVLKIEARNLPTVKVQRRDQFGALFGRGIQFRFGGGACPCAGRQ